MSIPLILSLLFGLGLFLLVYPLLGLLGDILDGAVRRITHILRPAAVRRIMEFQKLAEGGAPVDGKAPDRRRLAVAGVLQWQPFWLAAATLAALLLTDRLFSPLAFILVLVGGEIYRSTYRSQRMQRLNEDVSSLIIQFASRYPITHSLARTLQSSAETLPDREVRRAVSACLARLAMNKPLAEAMQPLQELKHTVLRRFGQVLAGAQDTNENVFTETLGVLRGEVEGRMDLRRQARQSLTLVRGTTRVLQIAVVIAAILAGSLGNWRSYFFQSTQNWMLFIGMLGVAALGSLYVETELRQLEV
ncbi:MAG: hypothetical protein WCE68_00400 [Anaerolineales bacterium]